MLGALQRETGQNPPNKVCSVACFAGQTASVTTYNHFTCLSWARKARPLEEGGEKGRGGGGGVGQSIMVGDCRQPSTWNRKGGNGLTLNTHTSRQNLRIQIGYDCQRITVTQQVGSSMRSRLPMYSLIRHGGWALGEVGGVAVPKGGL